MQRHILLPQLAATLVALLAACLIATFFGPPAAAATKWVKVEDGRGIAVTGGGWGHGRGMSQYGARGAATAGLRYQQILAFYYPGTTLAEGEATMRVLLSGTNPRVLNVRNVAGLRVRDTGRKSTFQLRQRVGITRWRLKQVKGKTEVSYRLNGKWHHAKVGGRKVLVGDGVIIGPDRTVTARVAGTDRTYRGNVRLTGGMVVNAVSMTDYLASVVPAEMPASWPAEAVRAQAVAARTYAMRKRAGQAKSSWDICDTTACQVYAGVRTEHPAATAAVRATARQILTYRGEPAFTEFSSSNGGWTVASGVPYQRAVEDTYDTGSGNPFHTWTKVVDPAVLETAYPALGTLQRLRVSARDGNGRWGGRATQVTLEGSSSTITITGDRARSVMGLRSTLFDLG